MSDKFILLEESGWQFFDDTLEKKTIKLESSMELDDLGDDFENPKERNGPTTLSY